MAVSQEQFNYIFEVVSTADDVVRLKNPEFVNGFHAIMMQAGRVDFTIERLRDVKANLKDAEAVLLENIAGLRSANPDQKPKGTNYARRVLRDKPLWRKVVTAHSLNSDDKENIAPCPSLIDDSDDPDETELGKILKKMSAKDAKVEFERHDYTLRHKLEGLNKLCNLMDRYLGMLTSRQKKLGHLEEIGNKWAHRLFEPQDIERIEKAEQEVADGSCEVKRITEVLDMFPDDFTKLCYVEDLACGVKRKADCLAEIDRPTNTKSKRTTSMPARGSRRNTRGKTARNTL